MRAGRSRWSWSNTWHSWEQLEVLGGSHREFPAGFQPDSGCAFLGMSQGRLVAPGGQTEGAQRAEVTGDEKCHPGARSTWSPGSPDVEIPSIPIFPGGSPAPKVPPSAVPSCLRLDYSETISLSNLYFVQPWRCSQLLALLWPFPFPLPSQEFLPPGEIPNPKSFPPRAPSPGSAPSLPSRAACPGIPGWNSKVRDVFWGGKQWD